LNHEYTAQEALSLLLEKLHAVNPHFAERAQIAIDAGIDEVAEQDILSGRGKRRKSSKRQYRRYRPLTDAESINVVLEVLQAHLVVHRKVVNSVIYEFSHVAFGRARQTFWNEPSAREQMETIPASIGQEKTIEIELMPESSRRTHDQTETVPLKSISESDLNELEGLIAAVRKLTQF
jgi:hypothetical protein